MHTVHLVYGWRSSEAVHDAEALWKEPVARLSHFDRNGQRVFHQDAIQDKVREIIRKAVGSKVIVFGVLFREHVKVLEEVCAKLPPASGKRILVPCTWNLTSFRPSCIDRRTQPLCICPCARRGDGGACSPRPRADAAGLLLTGGDSRFGQPQLGRRAAGDSRA